MILTFVLSARINFVSAAFTLASMLTVNRFAAVSSWRSCRDRPALPPFRFRGPTSRCRWPSLRPIRWTFGSSVISKARPWPADKLPFFDNALDLAGKF